MHKISLKFVSYLSPEYYQAASLRYRLFFQEHAIPFASLFDAREKRDWHLVVTTDSDNQVLAYGRLSQKTSDLFQIYQMVVEPDYQKQGLGTQILQTLVELAIAEGAKKLILHARVSKIDFYRRFGFKPVGEIFPSPSTGVPHITMEKEIPPSA